MASNVPTLNNFILGLPTLNNNPPPSHRFFMQQNAFEKTQLGEMVTYLVTEQIIELEGGLFCLQMAK